MSSIFQAELNQGTKRDNLHRAIYLLCLVGIALSMLLSRFLVSIFTLLLVVNFLAQGDYRHRWQALLSHRPLLIFLLLIGVHMAGLLWSTDIQAALADLRIKAPLLALPVIIALSKPLKGHSIRSILFIFAGAATAISIGEFVYWLQKPGLQNPREISLFVSHIRYALMINLSMALLLYYSFISKNNRLNRWQSLAATATMLWLAIFLVVLRSYTGLILMVVLAYGGAFFALRHIPHLIARLFVMALLVVIGLSSAAWLSRSVGRYLKQEQLDRATLEQYTAEGNEYSHQTEGIYYENGHIVTIYICREELEREWEKRSRLDYHGYDHAGNELELTLIRYLTSKGLRKDAEGVKALGRQDIENIEKGMANHIYADTWSVYPYLYDVLWQIDIYSRGLFPAGHSVGMRLFYLDMGWQVFAQNPWFGVGTGDVQGSLYSKYKHEHAHLPKGMYHLPHNQYLTWLVAFGLIGFLICMAAILLPIFIIHGWQHMLISSFMAIALLSMLNEDTLEPQIGLAFFAFFYSLFIFGGLVDKNKNET